MKSLLLTVTISVLAGCALCAQTPKFAWVKTIVSPGDPLTTLIEMFDVQTSATGETFVFGYFQEKLQFGNGINIEAAPQSDAYFIAKYSTGGDVQWVRKIGPVNKPFPPPLRDTTGGSIEVDPEGNVYVTGKFSNPAISFDATHHLGLQCPGDCADVFVVKYNASGAFLWAKSFSSGEAGARLDADGIAVAADASVYVSGSYSGNTVIYDTIHIFNGLRNDGCFLARLQPDGALQWAHFPNQDGIIVAQQLQVMPSGDVWMGGFYGNGSIDFGNDVALGLYGDPDFAEFFLVRYNANGDAQEAINFNSPNEDFSLAEIAAAPDSSLLIINDFRSVLRKDSTVFKQALLHGALLTRYRNGQHSQEVFIPYPNLNSAPMTSIAVSSNGQFFSGGMFGSQSLSVPGGPLQNQGNQDLVLLTGPTPWKATKGFQFGGEGFEVILNFYYGHSIRTDASGNVYLAGLFEEMNLSGFKQPGFGIFVGKINSETVGADEPEISATPLVIEPNPSGGVFRVLFAQSEPKGVLVIQDLHGKTLLRRAVSAPSVDLDLPLPVGVYTCIFYGEKGVERGRVMVIR